MKHFLSLLALTLSVTGIFVSLAREELRCRLGLSFCGAPSLTPAELKVRPAPPEASPAVSPEPTPRIAPTPTPTLLPTTAPTPEPEPSLEPLSSPEPTLEDSPAPTPEPEPTE